MEEAGVGGWSMSEVARRLGMRPPSLNAAGLEIRDTPAGTRWAERPAPDINRPARPGLP
jgi:hypothetical protein